MGNYKDASRKTWIAARVIDDAIIQTGCLQRIADATEAMAENHIKLTADRDLYKKWYEEQRESGKRMAQRIFALQGVITKLKKKKS